ncbi:MAG: hypothetical protein AB9917_17155 [Negativicutes bacterium]
MKRIQVLFVLMLGVCVWMGGGNGVLQAAPAENPYAVAGIDNATEFEKAFNVLQAAVAANNRNKVADHILYPLRVSGWRDELIGKGTFQFETRQEVLDHYDEIFTPQVKTAIVQQKTVNLFVNWQGVMVGNGEAWLSISEKAPRRYGIFAINLRSE